MDDDEKQEKRELRNLKRRMKYSNIEQVASSKETARSGVRWKKNVNCTINPEESSPELHGQFETSSNYSEEAEILLAEMERQDDETNEKHKAVLNEQGKAVAFTSSKLRKTFKEPLKLPNKPSTVRDRKNTLKKLLKVLEVSSGVSGMLFLHSPNWKQSSVRINVYGKIGRKFKKTPVFKLVCKAFHKEVAIFNSKRPPPVADKNALYVHEDDEPVEEQTLAQDEAALDEALQDMPTFKGEHLNDEIPDEFDSEGANTDDDEAVAPVATKKNAQAVDTMSNVSPLLIAPPMVPSVTNLPVCSVGPLQKVSKPPAGTTIWYLPPKSVL